LSVENLIRSQVASYLEFNNVNQNFFYCPTNDGASLSESLIKIPFSKSEIFTNTVLSFKEKRQLVKVIEMCLTGTDLEEKRQLEAKQEEAKRT
jgi:RAB protein geranylgeranyltransferase component A